MKLYKDWDRRPSEDAYLIIKIQEIVAAMTSGATVILFGSRARGTALNSSDWDFLILTEHDLDRKSIREIKDRIYDLEVETDTVLSTIIRTRNEWNSSRYAVLPFRHAIEEEGILL
jgi:uncharacterized protein